MCCEDQLGEDAVDGKAKGKYEVGVRPKVARALSRPFKTHETFHVRLPSIVHCTSQHRHNLSHSPGTSLIIPGEWPDFCRRPLFAFSTSISLGVTLFLASLILFVLVLVHSLYLILTLVQPIRIS